MDDKSYQPRQKHMPQKRFLCLQDPKRRLHTAISMVELETYQFETLRFVIPLQNHHRIEWIGQVQ